jgi:cytidylate kinase
MSRLFILEGPDGSGKTTLAQALTRAVQGMLIHHGSYLKVSPQDLADVYEVSMMPATHGYVDTVLDRSWLSEPIYGAVMRAGLNRLSPNTAGWLEGIAAACDGVVVLCLPPFEVCAKSFEGRPQEEYLKRTDQLRRVWDGYAAMKTSLPVLKYDRTQWEGGAPAFAIHIAEGRFDS